MMKNGSGACSELVLTGRLMVGDHWRSRFRGGSIGDSRGREPEIVLTDINMPKMNGLQMAERLREADENCHIVIITKCREFEYARQAVRIGVEDFLLKPVDMEELGGIILRIREKVLAERQKERQQEAWREYVSKDIVRESFYQRLVEGRVEIETARQQLEWYQAGGLLNGFYAVNIQLQDMELLEDPGDMARKIQMLLQSEFKPALSFVHYTFHVLAFFEEMRFEEELGACIQECLRERLYVETNLGISGRQTGVDGIARAYRETGKALSAVVVFGMGSCVTYAEYQAIETENENETDINWSEFVSAVENGRTERVDDFVREYTEKIRLAGVLNVEYLRLMTMNMILRAEAALNLYGKSTAEVLGERPLYMEISRIHTTDEMRELLLRVMRRITDFHRGIYGKKGNRIIEQAAAYIERNMKDPELSLKRVAAAVFANESYLSRIFKREMGESMIEYITRKRIAESVRLLNTSNLKVYEIAEQVGFRDPHYFSICFKKQMGVTVKEFRQRNG